MKNYKELLSTVAVSVPEILLPAEKENLNVFSVIACDQFSANPDYWAGVEEIVKEKSSAFHMILPEAYLENEEKLSKLDIASVMENYLEQGVLKNIGEGFIYLHRNTSAGVRKGLIIALDLEEYDFSTGSRGLIRATEKTVIDRLPARISLRETAPLEMPHVMVLINDMQNDVLGMIEKELDTLEKLYDFELMMYGGHITAWVVNKPEMLLGIAESLVALKANSDGVLYAMGDGNHSFAAAKSCWEALKPSLSKQELINHPARFSLVEIVNLYDDAVNIEPIHRLIFQADIKEMCEELSLDATNPPSLQILQPALDAWLEKNPRAKQEYIHGDEECRELADTKDKLAIIFPEFDKDSLFKIIREDGVFARKSFSIGNATDKRYYLECRKIK